MNKRTAKRDPMIVITGSCQNFEEERKKIIDFLGELELGAKMKVEYQCYSTGISMGWEFFELCLDPDVVYALYGIFPEIHKEEGSIMEQQFVHWLSKQLKRKKMEFFLKLGDVPSENASGFRLDPENYRDDKLLEELK